jgi:hypothetical protein
MKMQCSALPRGAETTVGAEPDAPNAWGNVEAAARAAARLRNVRRFISVGVWK